VAYAVRVSQTVADAAIDPSRTRPRANPRDPLWMRLVGLTGSDRFWGWAGPLFVMIIGGYQRFRHLGRPHRLIFDETYYVKEGVSYLLYGYERGLKESILADADKRNEAADKLFTQGNIHIFSDAPDRVVHPMVGKWMIAAGEWLFGPTSAFGWRFASAVVGTLAILMIGRIGRRLLGSTLLGTTAAVLLAVDGEEFVHSRTGILDIFVMFWALAAFGCLLIDRDQARERLLRLVGELPERPRFGPWLGVRPWRIAGIVCLAMCTGVKWSGLYFSVAFLLMSVLWDVAARRAAGVRLWLPGAALTDAVQAGVTSIVLLPGVYLATWVTWFTSTDAWNRQWGAEHPAQAGWEWVPNALRSLWHYHAETWEFHHALTSPHDWQAPPWAWMVLGRPTLFLFDTHTDGHAGCHAETCRQMVTALGNPVIWWAATIGLGVALFRWALARDWRAGAVLAGLVGGYLPWFQYQYRTIFEFYAVAFAPWVVLIVVYCLGLVLGPPGASERRRRRGALAAGSYVLAAVLAFWFFFPIFSGRTVPQSSIDLRDWFPSWY
jgi:dolichyl-phosphate-mannose--protein O-mannosyl transferase